MADWDYDDPRFQTLRMEDMVRAPASTLGAWLEARLGGGLVFPPDDDFQFDRFSSGRRPGELDPASHYRSGREDQWRGEMSSDLARRITADLGEMMGRFYPDSLP